ncbi:MAG: hypothetical protein H0X38_02650 [Planctomycetes bacterium]|nr:hypothetical protein [Planctomycetota bacterium]
MGSTAIPTHQRHAQHADTEPGPGGPAAVRVRDEDEDGSARSGAPAWFLSVGLHGVVALIFAGLVYAAKAPVIEQAPWEPPQLTPLVNPPENPPVVANQPRPEIDTTPVEEEAAPTTPIVEPVADEDTSDADTDDAGKSGDPTAVSTMENHGAGIVVVTGAGGPSSGIFSLRTPDGRKKAAKKGGGGPATEAAVHDSLRWFKRHQSANGMWDAEHYQDNCQTGLKCEPGSTTSSGGSDVNVALTGYALLCYLGAGYDHKLGTYRTTVQKALDYLLAAQKPDGLLGVRNYEHAVAAMALAEAYGMTGDPALRAPAQKAATLLVSRQARNPSKQADRSYGGLGWDYVDGNPARNDSSVSGWCVMALKSAVAAGLDVGTGMAGARSWLDQSWKAANPEWRKLVDPYTARSSFPYTWDATSDVVQIDPPGSSAHDLAPVGAVCAVFLGHHQGDIMLESLCNHIDTYQHPTTYPCNTYYLYYNTMAIFQAGGERWQRWNKTMSGMLLASMRREPDCFAGSWDPANTVFHGSDTGRVLSTAYCCLCLEVYYRYRQIGKDAAGPVLH